ncbi:MAG TPA: hypothetical protein VFB76_18155 [Candidatus Angelobacter sp.]|nr:hypothetical protein [Candidatus Angelobacter sp.]
MAAWTILIKKNSSPPPAPGVVFEFTQSPDVKVDDQIIWSNHDTQAHWPGLPGDSTFFFDQPIPGVDKFGPKSSSTFVPGKPGTINYICSIHPDETGVIEVQPSGNGS